MYAVPFATGIDVQLADSLITTARTTLGDSLRSVVVFDEREMDLLYVREDLYSSTQGAMEVKSRLVEFEREGLDEAPLRTVLSVPREPSSIGRYHFTVRVHENGYVLRIVGETLGVLLTTDEIDRESFDDVAVAAQRLFTDAS